MDGKKNWQTFETGEVASANPAPVLADTVVCQCDRRESNPYSIARAALAACEPVEDA